MKDVISSEIIPIKLWLDDIEEGASEQAKNLANLPFAFRHIAIMPDCHRGYGMPIGGVLAAKHTVIPNAVGVDIGCGVCAVKTSLTEIDRDTLKKIMGEIRKAIPVGFKKHKKRQAEEFMPDLGSGPVGFMDIVKREWDNALKSLGTLGGGNHFIEIQRGSDAHIWIMIHSGSRNLGKQVADHYNKMARGLNKKWNSQVPDKWGLAFLPVETEEGKAYLQEMNGCVEFALANRKLMMARTYNILCDICHLGADGSDEMINIAHNYATMENHFGENVMIHRKGATSAREDETGIIPGSQGAKSYIVRGKGNPESYHSCSHGAGRKMSRTKARQDLDLESEIKKLDDQGIIHGIRHRKDLDEASSAYKDVEEVMRNQSDLVEIVVELQPLAVIKG